ncbi:MAG: HNH endonuclease [Cryobacterium sp.]|nr:HNH endonuclease [Oligoflexia bacterium]
MNTHEELHEKTLTAAKQEKLATLELLKFLLEVEDRRTYAVLGFPSMFKYVEEGLTYSPAQASDRVAAMRLLRKVPEIATQLERGTQTLTSVAKIASHVRRENLDGPSAQALVLATSNFTIQSLEKHLLSQSLVEPPKLERAKIISAELTRLTLDVEEEFMALVDRIRELRGNPALPLSEVFRHAMKEEIKKKEVKVQESRPAPFTTSVTEVRLDPNPNAGSPQPEAVPQTKTRTRYIRAKDRAITRKRAEKKCEYIHRKSGRRCGSRFGPQMEHVIPHAKGGSNTPENLKLYCPAHNRLAAIAEFGEAKMAPFLRMHLRENQTKPATHSV